MVFHRYRLLIADRNPRIRDFLKREFTLVGYEVRLAENSEQVLSIVLEAPLPDLLIIDPDFPDADSSTLLKILQDRVPRLPVVLHTLDADLKSAQLPWNRVQWVEKNGSSVEKLKQTVAGNLSASRQSLQR
jgi:DNA-binding NtrC family response regulator